GRPDWVSEEGLTSWPEELTVREVRVRVPRPGFRTRVLVVVTTLVDAVAYPARDVGELDRARWQAELDLRSLKVTLGMGVLRCKSPGMVRKEGWGHLLGYNLIRGVMAEAAAGHGVRPRELSFAGAAQTVAAWASSYRRHCRANSSASSSRPVPKRPKSGTGAGPVLPRSSLASRVARCRRQGGGVP